MIHTTFLLHGQHDIAKERRAGSQHGGPSWWQQAEGLPCLTVMPFTIQEPSHTQNPWYFWNWVENTQFRMI